MPQPFRVYRTHLGFYDAIVAAPSQKAALEAWGVRQNLFQKGMASVVGDDEIIRLARSKPGVVLRRMFGSKEALFLAVLERALDRLMATFVAAVDEGQEAASAGDSEAMTHCIERRRL